MAVQIQLGAEDRLRPGDGAYALENVALAVVVAVGHHGAVQKQQHDVHRHRGAQVGEQQVAQFLVHVAQRDAGRLREGGDAFGNRVTIRLAQFAPFDQRDVSDRWRVAATVVAIPVTARHERRAPRRDRGECVCFGRQRRHEKFHRAAPRLADRPPPPTIGGRIVLRPVGRGLLILCDTCPYVYRRGLVDLSRSTYYAACFGSIFYLKSV